MSDYNRVILCGHLGRDCELRYTPAGAAVATLNLATSEKWTGKDGQAQERTEWTRCSLWGKPAESLKEYLTKGKNILVEGRLRTNKWKDKDGNDRYTTEVNVDRLVLLGGGNGQGRPRREDADDRPARRDESTEPARSPEAAYEPLTDDDIPF